MHSRIIQLSTKPIDKDNFLSESLFYDGFVGTIADYVDENTDREKDIKWFVEFLNRFPCTYNNDEKSIVFHKDFKEKYFEEKYKLFKKASENITLDDFCGNKNSTKIYDISSLINDRYGFYVYFEDDYSLYTLDEFVRYNLEKREEKYYFGNTIDYHY